MCVCKLHMVSTCLTLEGTALLLAAFCQQITTGNDRQKKKRGETRTHPHHGLQSYYFSLTGLALRPSRPSPSFAAR